MMLSSPSICSILLALSFHFNRAQGDMEIIGYRTASDAEAVYINENHKLDPNIEYDRGMAFHQLGRGFYMSNVPTRWRARSNEWYCAVKADSDKLEDIGKVWIPKAISADEKQWPLGKPLWYQREEVLLSYIKEHVPEDPEKALRFSYLSSYENDLQMVIPHETIKDDKLELWLECWKTEGEMLDFSNEIINWDKYEIAGKPEPAAEEAEE
ncbi:hypothetical protein MBM_02933 [Drepanopeziza brunnea f. sp. 'multigermtubi' MB_m1]|uniref:Uncharacterized protein n=1 Tax=Marssonina brunnea f. sp. multigermtubi (strain MB_m1) TaxID=1072389 RepID=K1X0L1_MARBU|nr:uncharacterized protein MBM_02933 [Drepanopeziza brunnea f. sp. 'multigermtubi' MB_m1]EKD18691.1 hypothetical protein MBM_02933 [Drepanopeziza brunnea f. sp. 'multigermtubi' MB_m1]